MNTSFKHYVFGLTLLCSLPLYADPIALEHRRTTENVLEEQAYNGLAFNSQQQAVNTTAHFTPRIMKNDVALNNGSSISLLDTVSLSMNIAVDSQHVGLPAILMIMALYTDAQQNTQVLIRQRQNWVLWDGSIEHVLNSAAELRIALAAQEHINIVENIVFNMTGQLQVLVAYAIQTADSSLIVFNGKQPLMLHLTE